MQILNSISCYLTITELIFELQHSKTNTFQMKASCVPTLLITETPRPWFRSSYACSNIVQIYLFHRYNYFLAYISGYVKLFSPSPISHPSTTTTFFLKQSHSSSIFPNFHPSFQHSFRFRLISYCTARPLFPTQALRAITINQKAI